MTRIVFSCVVCGAHEWVWVDDLTKPLADYVPPGWRIVEPDQSYCATHTRIHA